MQNVGTGEHPFLGQSHGELLGLDTAAQHRQLLMGANVDTAVVSKIDDNARIADSRPLAMAGTSDYKRDCRINAPPHLPC